jgi:hypothetical protein
MLMIRPSSQSLMCVRSRIEVSGSPVTRITKSTWVSFNRIQSKSIEMIREISSHGDHKVLLLCFAGVDIQSSNWNLCHTQFSVLSPPQATWLIFSLFSQMTTTSWLFTAEYVDARRRCEGSCEAIAVVVLTTFGNNRINNNWWHFYRFVSEMERWRQMRKIYNFTLSDVAHCVCPRRKIIFFDFAVKKEE